MEQPVLDRVRPVPCPRGALRTGGVEQVGEGGHLQGQRVAVHVVVQAARRKCGRVGRNQPVDQRHRGGEDPRRRRVVRGTHRRVRRQRRQEPDLCGAEQALRQAGRLARLLPPLAGGPGHQQELPRDGAGMLGGGLDQGGELVRPVVGIVEDHQQRPGGVAQLVQLRGRPSEVRPQHGPSVDSQQVRQLLRQPGLSLAARSVQQPGVRPVRPAPGTQFVQQVVPPVERHDLPPGLQQGRRRRQPLTGDQVVAAVGQVLELRCRQGGHRHSVLREHGPERGVVQQHVHRDDIEATVRRMRPVGGDHPEQHAVGEHGRAGQAAPRGRPVGGPPRGVRRQVQHVLVVDEAAAGIDGADELLGLHTGPGRLGDVRYAPGLARRPGPPRHQPSPAHRPGRRTPRRPLLDQHQRRVVPPARRPGPHHRPARRPRSTGTEHLHPGAHRPHHVRRGQHQAPAHRIPRPRPAGPRHRRQPLRLHPPRPLTPRHAPPSHSRRRPRAYRPPGTPLASLAE